MERLLLCKMKGMEKFNQEKFVDAFAFFSLALDFLKSCSPLEKALLEPEISNLCCVAAKEVEKKMKVSFTARKEMWDSPRKIPEWYSLSMDDAEGNVFTGISLSVMGRTFKRAHGLAGALGLAWYCFTMSNLHLERYLKDHSSDEVYALGEANVKELSEFRLVPARIVTTPTGRVPTGIFILEKIEEETSQELIMQKELDKKKSEGKKQEELKMEAIKEEPPKVDVAVAAEVAPVPVVATVEVAVNTEDGIGKEAKPTYGKHRKLKVWEYILLAVSYAFI